MTTTTDTQATILLCHITTADSVASVRQIFDWLNAAGLNWHPDDDANDIIWAEHEIDGADAHRLNSIMERLCQACREHNLDVYEESMQSHVRMHGERSCFYPEHIPFEQRLYRCVWAEGYTDGDPIVEENTLDFFTEEIGYEEDYQQQIRDLCLDDMADFGGPMGIDAHTVTRIR